MTTGAGLIHDFPGIPRVVLRLGKVDCGIREFLQHRVRAFAFDLAVVAVDRLQDDLPGGQRDFDLSIEDKAKFIEGFQVVRVAHNHPQGVVIDFIERQNRVFAGDGLRDEFDDRGRNRCFGQIDELEVVFLRHGPHDLFARRVPQIDEGVPDADPLFGGDLVSVRELFFADDSVADQD